MRLGTASTKVPFRTLKTKHAPAVRPPGLLSLFSVLCILSMIGTLAYAVALTVMSSSGHSIDPLQGVVIAQIHFLLPVLIAYSVSTNSSWSRPLIAIYSSALAAQMLLGFGYLAPMAESFESAAGVTLTVLALILVWLYGSPKMRIYYALIQDRPLPASLAERAIDYVENPWPGPKTRAAFDWLSDHMETIVLLGLIVTVILAFARTTHSGGQVVTHVPGTFEVLQLADAATDGRATDRGSKRVHLLGERG